MALSWNELRADHKVVLVFDSLNEEDLQTPIACRFCDAIFYDNKSLLNHFHSHFHQDGAYNGRLLIGSSVPPRNSSSFISLQPNWSSNFNSGFASQPSGPLDLCSPVRLTSADIFNSEPTTRSTFRFPTAPGTTGLSLRTTRFLPQTARRNEVEGSLFGYTKPYINQLDRPIQKTIVVCDGGNCSDQIDLTLKL